MSVRNAMLSDLAEMLKSDEARKLDAVAPAAAIEATDAGTLVVDGIGEPTLTETGVTPASATLTATQVGHEGIAAKLGIPSAYLRKTAEHKPELWAANVNGWLTEDPARKFMLRTFRGEDGGQGILRAFLSDSYLTIDNFDVLLAVLSGIKEAGHPVEVTGADLTDRRMIVRVKSDAVAVAAPELLKGYRSPFSGSRAEENPLVSAGFVITNSEVGSGAFTITPRLVVQICTNGMTMARDAMRSVHLGAKMDEGVIKASQVTQERQLALIASRSSDAVRAFLSQEYVNRTVDKLNERAGVPVSDAAKTVEIVGKAVGFGAGAQASILDHFIRGGQLTAGGIMQAVTSAAQDVSDGDAAYDMEAQAFPALVAASNIRA